MKSIADMREHYKSLYFSKTHKLDCQEDRKEAPQKAFYEFAKNQQMTIRSITNIFFKPYYAIEAFKIGIK